MAWEIRPCPECGKEHLLQTPASLCYDCAEEQNPSPIFIGIVWNTSGGTRGFKGGGKIPKTPTITNPGHNPPRLSDLGLSNEDGKKLGIK